MGEAQTAHLRKLGFEVGLDEPSQHYQFAGRADVIAWSVERAALLHIENRTRFPDIHEVVRPRRTNARSDGFGICA
jgi:hypothetical protein